MPLIEVTLVEGRSAEQLRALIHGLTQAASDSVDAPVASIRVVVREVPPTHWAAGDVTVAERTAHAPTATDDGTATPEQRQAP